MNKNKYALTFALGLVSAILSSQSAHAAVSASAGDLILAFRDTTNVKNVNLEVDLGSYSQFVTWAQNNPGQLFNLNYNTGGFFGTSGGLAVQDLRNLYGDGSTDSSWNSLSTLKWSVAGAIDLGTGENSLFATGRTTGTAPNAAGASTQNTVLGSLNSIRSLLNGKTSLTSPQAASILTSNASSYSTKINFTNNYNSTIFSPNSTKTTENVVSASGTSLKLYELDSANSGLAGTELGTFALGGDGTLTFTAAVPEPSSIALMSIAAVGLAGMRRRRATVTA